MQQQTLAMAADHSERFERFRRPPPRDVFLTTMAHVVPWAGPGQTTLYRPVQRHAASFIAHTEASTGILNISEAGRG